MLDPARFQFALTALFHMTFPAVTVGLGLFLAVIYGIYYRTDAPLYYAIYRFWRKIFALGFALGVVSGTVMTFEFGLNWSGFAHAAGPIVGVIIGMEVVTAFFLEAAFIGIMLYGEGKVSKGLMFFSVCMVALGSALSTTWIMVANSWLHTPVGFELVNGQFRPEDWWAILFNPAFAWRFPHILTGVLISASFFVAGVASYYLLKEQHLAFAKRTFLISFGALTLLVPTQHFLGDSLAVFMSGAQPPKVQAIEGNWNSQNTGYNLFIVPDQAEGRNRVTLSIPCLGAVILNRDFTCSQPVPGLSETPSAQQPPMGLVFYGFRLMYLLAAVMFTLIAAGVWLRLRGKLFGATAFHRAVLWMTPSGVLAIWGGWLTSESGRQPFVVYGELLTNDAVSPLPPAAVITTLVLFALVYLLLLSAYVFFVVRIVRSGPHVLDPSLEPGPESRRTHPVHNLSPRTSGAD